MSLSEKTFTSLNFKKIKNIANLIADVTKARKVQKIWDASNN